MKLIVGLGNPGQAYATNRHNVGFLCLNYLAKTHAIKFDQKSGHARIGAGQAASETVILAKPQTFMNESGRSVSQLVKKSDIDLNDLIIVHDDLDLPLGKIRIRPNGSSAGHKGIASIIEALGSEDFIRIRIGIGRPAPAEDSIETNQAEVVEHVLGDFTPEEKQVMAQVIPQVSEAILCLLAEGVTAAMNRYN